MTLQDYLDSCRRRRWEWGAHDCTLFAADWVRLVTGLDPAADWRGRYASADECRSRLSNAGGIEAVVSRSMRLAGLAETTDPRPGDVGLVRAPTGVEAMGVISAICQGDLWVARTVGRVVAAPFPLVRAWRVGA
ncbi:DUF6950 family protein [Zavarzinia sp.]|uniref:DUF6950 family protein n=1 Tax=Zavarzinia sp. TaxID=2027920 RepID=UPI003BB71249